VGYIESVKGKKRAGERS